MKSFFLLLFLFTLNLSAATYNNCPKIPVDTDDPSMDGISLYIHYFALGKVTSQYWTSGDGSELETPNFKTYQLFRRKPMFTFSYSDQGGRFEGKTIKRCKVINGVKTIKYFSFPYTVKVYEDKARPEDCSMLDVKYQGMITKRIRLCP